jgi:tetratricopeptide (TPR) repeat protein
MRRKSSGSEQEPTGAGMSGAFEMSDEAHRLSGAGNDVEALALCDKIIANWPHAYVGHHRKAHVLDKMGEKDLALKSARRVIELLPEDAFPYFSRARMLMTRERYREAIDDFDKAEARDQKDHWFGPMIPLLRAECNLKLGNLAASEADCAKVPDDFVYPGFRGLMSGSKHHVLHDVRRLRHGRLRRE